MLSIIVPTYNEEENVKLLCLRIAKALAGVDYEIVFVDDSTDSTPELLEEISQLDPRVRYAHRTDARGLATAVAEGFKLARGEYLAVMDADLQHPPEFLAVMHRALQAGADMVIPSRFVPGGSDGGLRIHRKLVSWTARTIGKVMLHKLKGITDPTGGFFMLRKEVLDGAQLNPIGWKILMEVLVKGNCRRIVEIPYRFARREHNTSKMELTEQVNYLRHLGRLVQISPKDKRFWRQAIREGIALVIGVAAFAIIRALLPEIWAALLAACAYIPANRFLNVSTGGRRYPYAPRRMSLALVMALSSSGIGGILLVFGLLHGVLGLPDIAAFLTGTVARTGMVVGQAAKQRRRLGENTTEVLEIE